MLKILGWHFHYESKLLKIATLGNSEGETRYVTFRSAHPRKALWSPQHFFLQPSCRTINIFHCKLISSQMTKQHHKIPLCPWICTTIWRHNRPQPCLSWHPHNQVFLLANLPQPKWYQTHPTLTTIPSTKLHITKEPPHLACMNQSPPRLCLIPAVQTHSSQRSRRV